MLLAPDTSSAVELAVGVASAQFTGLTLLINNWYQLSTNTGLWFAVGANPTASAGNGSVYLGPNQTALIYSLAGGEKVAIIEDTTAGKASLARLNRY